MQVYEVVLNIIKVKEQLIILLTNYSKDYRTDLEIASLRLEIELLKGLLKNENL